MFARSNSGLTIAMRRAFEIRDGHSYHIRFTEVELGPEIPDSRLDLPDEIRELLDSTIND